MTHAPMTQERLNYIQADTNALSECYLVIRELTARDIRRAKEALSK